MNIVFRGCRVSDLQTGLWALLNYGLANYRTTSTAATFTTAGFTTAGLSTTLSPQVAFCYACLGLGGGQTAVFALKCSDTAFGNGSVEAQALAQIYAADGSPNPGYDTTARSVTATREVVLPSVERPDVLGYFTVQNAALQFDINTWTTVAGSSAEQVIGQRYIQTGVDLLKQRFGGSISGDNLATMNAEFLGH